VAYFAALSLSAILVIVCISPNTYSAQPEGYSVIRIGTVEKPDSFNPFSALSFLSHSLLMMTYEMLLTPGPDLSPCPQLAESYMVSEDWREWTFNLSADSYWHDGFPVTAHDANFTFNMMLRNELECALLGGYLQDVTDVRALDDHTLQVTTDVPKSTMLSIYIPILPEHYWSAVEDDGVISSVEMWDETYFPNGPIGSGPLILDEYSKALGYIRMLKSQDYHMGSVNVDEVLFMIYNTAEAMATALTTESIDVALDVPTPYWDSLVANEGIEGQAASTLNLRDFGFNCASQELRESTDSFGVPNFPSASSNLETTNLSVRQAIAMAINKTEIVEEVIMGFGQEGDSIVPMTTPFWHYEVPEEDEYKFDIAAANALLNDSGYNRDDDGDGVRENETSGAELSFSFYYISSNTADQLTAEKIEGWLSQIGVEAPAQGVPEGVLYTMWFGLEYDLFVWGWQPDPDPSFILSVLTTEMIPEDCHDATAWSDVFYSNAYYDQLYIDQLHEVDVVDRQAIVHEMQQIAYTDCPYVVLYYPNELIAYRTDKFTNYPDMTTYPGTAPEWIWFYFDLLPVGDPNPNPPYNVDAGADCTTVSYGETHSFTGYAEDDDDPMESLNWSWTFVESDWSVRTLYGQTVNYTFENPGTVTVTLTVRDPAGSSDSDGVLVNVSLPPPPETLASISGEEGMNGWYVSSVDVALDTIAVAGVVGTYYSVNSGEWQEYAEPFIIDVEGVNTLEYYSIDPYGVCETPNSTEVSIDTAAPSSSIALAGTSGADGWYRSSVEVTISASDASSGIHEISYALDGAEWTAYDAEFIIHTEGSHSFLVRSGDVAGNIEQALLEEFHIDLTDPELTITSPAAEASTSSSVISWECSDNMGISSTEISVDSQAWQSIDLDGGLSFDYVLDVPDGEHEVRVRATDFAGNEVTGSLSFVLDTTAPTLLILAPSEGAAIRGNDVEISWESSDNILVDSTEMNIDGSGWTAVTPSGSDSLSLELGHGEHTVQLRVTDSAGNENVSSVTFEVNSSALSFGGPYYGLPLVGLIAAIVAAVALSVKVLRGRNLI